jgi:acyl-CoA hydrolase
MRVWRCELYADEALQLSCVTVYVKAIDFIEAVRSSTFRL